MKGANTQLQGRMIAHAVDISRYDIQLQNEVVEFLAELRADVIAQLEGRDPAGVVRTQFRRARMEALLQDIDGITRTYYGEAEQHVAAALRTMAGIAAEAPIAILNNVAGARLGSMMLTQEQLSAITSNILIDGAPSASWWAKQTEQAVMDFSRTVRMGMAQGQTTEEMARVLRGYTPRTGEMKGQPIPGLLEFNPKRANADARALVRSSVQTVANEAHLEQYRANADILQGFQWLSTLDWRTTTECRRLDGLMWDIEGVPIGHGVIFPGPTAHWGCRSTQIPITKSWEQLMKEARSHGSVSLARELDKIGPGQRASMNGQVPGTLTYPEWLKGESEGVQRRALGDKRYEAWKQGNVSGFDLVDPSGNPLTLNKLGNRSW